jgi:regulator of replication initiation timing
MANNASGNEISEELRSAIFMANSLALRLIAYRDRMDSDAARIADQIREQLKIAVSQVGTEEDRYYIEKANREGFYLCSNWYAGRSRKRDSQNQEHLDDDADA